ncbi:hypothetical protein BpHYR1_028482 [Brachionus plicatilis]|uniref:Uncharacterized protein n=1 Tax=Brachionus plicatilis TaxID=10195 RepID=A0A3M7R9F9_BRAPC|nr:hypothetical protein BpHYR1_028482 [Brachionus plicatilis]
MQSFCRASHNIQHNLISSRLDLEKNSVDSSRPSRFPTLTLTQNCAGWSRKVEYQFYLLYKLYKDLMKNN